MIELKTLSFVISLQESDWKSVIVAQLFKTCYCAFISVANASFHATIVSKHNENILFNQENKHNDVSVYSHFNLHLLQ